MTRLKVTQVRSVIDRPKDQKQTVRRLGLHRINDAVVKDDRPEIRGMIAKVGHLVRVEEVADDEAKDTGPKTSGRKTAGEKTAGEKTSGRKTSGRKTS